MSLGISANYVFLNTSYYTAYIIIYIQNLNYKKKTCNKWLIPSILPNNIPLVRWEGGETTGHNRKNYAQITVQTMSVKYQGSGFPHSG
jgi:hypothetical protein